MPEVLTLQLEALCISSHVVAHGEATIPTFVVQHRQGQLLEVVRALGAAGRFAGRLDRGQQKCDQDSNDRNDDEQLDEREATPLCTLPNCVLHFARSLNTKL